MASVQKRARAKCDVTAPYVYLAEQGGAEAAEQFSPLRTIRIDRNRGGVYSSSVKLLDRNPMDIVTVKSKFQIVIPQHVRELAHIEIGDLLEAGVENGKIVFTPKSLVDRHIAEGLEDMRAGRTHGPYTTASEAVAALETRTKRPAKKRRR